MTALLAAVPIIVSSRRDYLHGYGTVDVGLLWGLSFLLPLIVYTIPRLILAWVNRYEPATGDKAWKLLSKLAKKQMRAGLPAVTNSSGAEFSGFALESRESGKDHYWIGPGIVATWSANQDAAMARLQTAADGQLTLKGSLAVLEGHLKEAKKANGVTLDYDPSAGIAGPQQAAAKDLTFHPDGVFVKSNKVE